MNENIRKRWYIKRRGSIQRKHGSARRGCTGWKMHPSRVVTQPSLHPANNHHHQHEEQQKGWNHRHRRRHPSLPLGEFLRCLKNHFLQRRLFRSAPASGFKNGESLIIRPANPDATKVCAERPSWPARNKSWSTWRDWNLSRRCRDLSAGAVAASDAADRTKSVKLLRRYLFVCLPQNAAIERASEQATFSFWERARPVSWAGSGVETMATAVPGEIELAPGMLYFQRVRDKCRQIKASSW